MGRSASTRVLLSTYFSCPAFGAGLSAALFAVAWPFDAEPEPGDDRSWRDRDEALWHGIASAWGGRRPLCTRLPLHTDFSLGAGRGMLHQVRCWPFCAAECFLAQAGSQLGLASVLYPPAAPALALVALPLLRLGPARCYPAAAAACLGCRARWWTPVAGTT